jgi:hypothetical protein
MAKTSAKAKPTTRSKVRARAKRQDVKRSAALPSRAKSAPQRRKPQQHKFVASHLGPTDF